MICLKQKYDASTVAVIPQASNEVATDRRFLVRKSVTTLAVAEHRRSRIGRFSCGRTIRTFAVDSNQRKVFEGILYLRGLEGRSGSQRE
jgi:hypothetical protein